MTMTDIKPKYEMPVGIAYANIRKGRTDIYSQIFEKYCPTIPVNLIPKSQRIEFGYGELDLGGEKMH